MSIKKLVLASLLTATTYSVSAGVNLPSHPFFERAIQEGAIVSQPEGLPQIAGFDSWELRHPDSNVPAVFFTTAGGEMVFSGAFMDRQGNDPVASYITKSALKNKPEAVDVLNEELEKGGESLRYDNELNLFIDSKSKAINQEGDLAWKALSQSLYFAKPGESADSERIVYVFVDPHCSACAKFWSTIEAYSAKGLSFRLVPVSFLKPESGKLKITNMLAAQDPYEAFAANELLFSRGGYPKADSMPDKVSAIIDMNYEMMQRFGANATPTLIIQNEKGETERVDALSMELLDSLTQF